MKLSQAPLVLIIWSFHDNFVVFLEDFKACDPGPAKPKQYTLGGNLLFMIISHVCLMIICGKVMCIGLLSLMSNIRISPKTITFKLDKRVSSSDYLTT